MEMTLAYNGDDAGDFTMRVLRMLDGWTADVTVQYPMTPETYESVRITIREDRVLLYADVDDNELFIASFDPRETPVLAITVD